MKGPDEHPSRRPTTGRTRQRSRVDDRVRTPRIRTLRDSASRTFLHDHDQGDIIDDKQRRLIHDYLTGALDHLHGIEYDHGDRTILAHLTDARNKLNVCIAILYADPVPVAEGVPDNLDGRTTAARPSSGGPAVDDD